MIIRKQRRADYRKRRHKKEEAAANVARPRSAAATSAVSGIGGGGGVLSSAAALAGNLSSLATSVASRGLSCLSDAPSLSSEDEAGSALAASQSDAEDVESDAEKQGPFAFRRKQHCNYLAVSWLKHDRFFFCLLTQPTQVVDFSICHLPADASRQSMALEWHGRRRPG